MGIWLILAHSHAQHTRVDSHSYCQGARAPQDILCCGVCVCGGEVLTEMGDCVGAAFKSFGKGFPIHLEYFFFEASTGSCVCADVLEYESKPWQEPSICQTVSGELLSFLSETSQLACLTIHLPKCDRIFSCY